MLSLFKRQLQGTTSIPSEYPDNLDDLFNSLLHRDGRVMVVDVGELMKNCNNDRETIRYMYEESTTELEEFMNMITKYSECGQLKKVRYCLEKMNGIAQFMYGHRLVEVTKAYLYALTKILRIGDPNLEESTYRVRLPPHVQNFIDSMNDLLLEVFVATVAVFPWSYARCSKYPAVSSSASVSSKDSGKNTVETSVSNRTERTFGEGSSKN